MRPTHPPLQPSRDVTVPVVEPRSLAFPLRPPWLWRAVAGALAFVIVLTAATAVAAAVAFGFESGIGGVFALAFAIVPGLFLIVRLKRPIERGLGRRWHRVTLEDDGTLTLRVGRWRKPRRLRLTAAARIEHGHHEYVTTTTVNQRPMKVMIRTAHLLVADGADLVLLVADDWGGEGETTTWPPREPPPSLTPTARMYARDLVRLAAAVTACRDRGAVARPVEP